MEPSVLSCVTLEDDDGGSHTEYSIELNGETTWRRFSAFVELDRALRVEIENDAWPMLPPPKVCGAQDPAFIESRRVELHHYFRAIFYVPGVRDTIRFQEFTNPNLKFIDGSSWDQQIIFSGVVDDSLEFLSGVGDSLCALIVEQPEVSKEVQRPQSQSTAPKDAPMAPPLVCNRQRSRSIISKLAALKTDALLFEAPTMPATP